MITSSCKAEDYQDSVPALDELARELTAKISGTVQRNEPMASHTTFRVGGPADLFLRPQDEADLSLMLSLLYQASVPVCVIGNGSNLLVADKGIRGAVIRLTPNFATLIREGDTIIAGAGAKLGRAVHFAAAEELSGLESTMGIPGTIGGALVMNAGTDVGSISDLVESATFLTISGEPIEKSGDQLAYGYRCSALQGGNLIVVSARLKLTAGERDAILAKMARLEEKRTSRQPTRCHTAGSTFKNQPDIAAGKLIDRAGCKGHRIGGAEVSEKHANFIIAHPGATASDIRNLAHWMHHSVQREFDRDLHMEVEIIGDWSDWLPSEPW
ncbi:MAG TPA: UDP-N-acetylmuramate dehydrogenase [Armatimonadota bacterium]|nr:UDP-N-acetylmuramate dehydrogenase [Armatimonadota bacterium]